MGVSPPGRRHSTAITPFISASRTTWPIDVTRGVALLDRSVMMGFYQSEYFERLCPFYEAARGRRDFTRVVARAKVREAEFAAPVG